MLVMAAIQLNDPDPLLWVTLYTAIAVVPAAKVINRQLPIFWGVCLGIVIACLAISLTGFIEFVQIADFAAIGGEMSEHKPYVESAREFLGTVIGLTCLLVYRSWHINGAINKQTT